MTYAKIRLPKTDVADQAFAELLRRHRVVGMRENGEIVYQIPTVALDTLDEMSVAYDLLDSDLATQVRPSGAP